MGPAQSPNTLIAMQIRLKLITLIILTFLILGCKDHQEPSHIQPRQKNTDEESKSWFLQRIIILNSLDFPSFSLDTLTAGYDSLQIRICTVAGLYDRTNLYIIKKNINGWSGQRLELELEEKFSNGDSTPAYLCGPKPFIIRNVRKIIPPFAWPKFISSIGLERLKSLPDMYSFIDNSIGSTDGTGYYLEFATKGFYHRSYYSNVDRLRNLHPNIKFVSDLIQTLQNTINPK
jgi:hypothetical protein